jgi:hypothetical protein
MTLAAIAYEALICLLLAAAVVMCWRVDRRLRALRSGQDGLKTTISDLNDAVDRARASLAALDRASKEQGAALKTDVEAARRLSDELRFLTDRGETQAQSALARRERPAPPQPTRWAPERTDEEQSLLDALKALR